MRRACGISATFLFLLAASARPVAALAEVLPESLLAVQLNGVDTGDMALVLRDTEGRPLLGRIDLERWRLGLSAATAFWQNGQAFYRLDDMAGITWKLDDSRQTLAIEAAADVFDRTRLDLAAQDHPVAVPASPGLLLNYDVSTTYGGQRRESGALLGLGAFNRLGSGVANFVVRDGLAPGPRVLRLDTGWNLDMQASRSSIRWGDTVSGSSQWGRSVRMGGLQWATNFGTQPGRVTFPLPSIAGQTALPSTVDLYVNGALQLRRDIPAGPFSLQQMPIVTGQGEMQLVVRDLLGREQRIVAPYYATPRLLQKGLHDFSYEIGRVREDFGLASNRYGAAALFATHRLGLSDFLTMEARGEWVGSTQAGGLGAVTWWPGLGTVSAALAASRSEGATGRSGQLLALSAERQARRFGFGVNTQFATRGFMQAGQIAGQLALRQTLQAFTSIALDRGSVSLAYLLQSPRDREAVRLLSLSYSVDLGWLGYLGVTLLRSAGPQGNLSASVTLTRALDDRTMASTHVEMRRGDAQGQLNLQRSLPAGEGTGYRVVGASGAAQHLLMAGSVRHAAGLASLEVDMARETTAMRANASGGLAWVGGGLYASPRIDESFAVVEVPGQPGVGVYADNQLVARTGADGKAMLPRLRAYQRNPLRIEQADLALDSQIGSLEMEAVPAYRSGMALQFPVHRSRSATLNLLQSDGRPVPAGAMASVDGSATAFPVGTAGQLYLSGLQAVNHVTARWGQGDRTRHCSFDLLLPAGTDPLPDLGVHACAVVPP